MRASPFTILNAALSPIEGVPVLVGAALVRAANQVGRAVLVVPAGSLVQRASEARTARGSAAPGNENISEFGVGLQTRGQKDGNM